MFIRSLKNYMREHTRNVTIDNKRFQLENENQIFISKKYVVSCFSYYVLLHLAKILNCSVKVENLHQYHCTNPNILKNCNRQNDILQLIILRLIWNCIYEVLSLYSL